MSNYKGVIAKVERVSPIEGADKIQIAWVLGECVIVSKDLEAGDVGLLFVSGTQLSEEYCKQNNLYRDPSMNLDSDKKGFFEKNRKVRAQPFMGIKSSAYFTDLGSLLFTGYDLTKLSVGDEFEELGGVKICCKYINPNIKTPNQQKKTVKKVVVPDFLEHTDTAQLVRNLHQLKKGDLISIQSKKHGTSFRSAYTKVVKPLGVFKELVNRILPIFPESTYEYVTGTRRVILESPDNEGFHGKDDYRFEVTDKLKPFLTKGMCVYGEIVGYVNGKPIMPDHDVKSLKDKKYTKKYGKSVTYKYNCLPDQYDFHIYRITMSVDGQSVDFTQQQLVNWCVTRGLNHAYDIIEPFIYNGDSEALLKLVEKLTERPDVLCEDYHDPSQISEGVIIRVDNENLTPLFLKSKSYAFKAMEGICEAIDPEDNA